MLHYAIHNISKGISYHLLISFSETEVSFHIRYTQIHPDIVDKHMNSNKHNTKDAHL